MAARLGPDLAPFRTSRDFRLLYLGQAASFCGSMITYVAAPYQAYRLTHSSLVVALLSVAELVPIVVTALLGGALADALDRRRLILVMECAVAACSVVLAANALLWHQLWLLFGVIALAAGCSGLQRPSLEALVPVLVSHADLPAAAGLDGLLSNAASLAGPLLGGVIIATAGLPAAYWAQAAACGLSLLAFGLMRASPPPPEAARPSLRGVAEGLRYARSRTELLGSYLVDMSAMFFGAPFALFPAFAARLGGPAVLGLLYAAPAAGALVVSVTGGWARNMTRHGRAIVVGACGWGAAVAAFGLARNLWLAVAALAAAGGADMLSALFRSTMWNQTIPAGLRGRLAGLEMISYTTGEPLGNLEAGLAASLTGSVPLAIVSGGIACVAAAITITFRLPALWSFDAAAGRPAAVRPA